MRALEIQHRFVRNQLEREIPAPLYDLVTSEDAAPRRLRQMANHVIRDVVAFAQEHAEYQEPAGCQQLPGEFEQPSELVHFADMRRHDLRKHQ